ncbi:hypothetical protein E2R51_07225 [Jeotgalibacillus sp. S-D1]|uniref:hypothetical protein n=1 Tax=Jeotgalibacillus sp. S-D1 TaxID=2552189 RepID=UPI00105A92BB|nr:hypothetical protein [Jeotgalibacillus sp. S-D1]TDL32473.1 hypothetical protein E2R51_07225 [Jeotgalibacillus sp. S-D1]
MINSILKSKRHRKMKKVKEGDGHLLKKYRIWNMFTHSLFHIKIINDRNGKTTKYALKSRYFTEEPRVDLYREGRHVAYSKLPAVLPTDHGVIEVTTTSSGISGIHYITDEEDSFSVYPEKRSIRGFRWWVHKRFPKISVFIGLIAIVTLLISIALGLSQLIETISDIPWVTENIGTFDSPINLSIWANFAIGIAAALAGTERALMLRKHWLIDIETSTWGEN